MLFDNFLSSQHHSDSDIGVYVVDRYTYYVLEFLENIKPNTKTTIAKLVGFWYSSFRITDNSVFHFFLLWNFSLLFFLVPVHYTKYCALHSKH